MTFSPLAPIARAVGRPTRLAAAAQAAVLTLLVAGAAGWAVFDRTVTLQVDGRDQQVRILGSEVSDVLAAADLQVGARDLVSPAPGETVADGATVVVRYARRLTVADPTGAERTLWTTELTVDDALAAAGLRTEDAWLSTSRSARVGRDGLSLTLSMPKAVTVVADGQTRSVTSPAPTVADLLAELGLALDADDRLSTTPEEVLAAGTTITVQRVAVGDVVEVVAVPNGSRTVADPEMFLGEDEVREAGAPGEQSVTSSVVTVDGVEESRTETARTTTREPVERVVAEGTKKRPVTPAPVKAAAAAPAAGAAAPAPVAEATSQDASGEAASEEAASPAPAVPSDVDSLNWAALAACESGGNPGIVSSNGKYHGLYQFSTGTWQSVGGSGVASQASAAEQTARAKALYARSGVGQWPHCGPRLYS